MTRPPSEIPIICIAGKLRKLSRIITNAYAKALHPVDLHVNQMTFLQLINKLGPITSQALADYMRIEKSSLSRDLARLKTAGWIIEETGDDKRQRLLSLTAAGQAKLKQTLPYWEKAQRAAEKSIGAEGIQAIQLLLHALDRCSEKEDDNGK